MALDNLRLLSQSAGYCVTVILSLCVVIPMIMNEASFKGNCLLFTSGQFIAGEGLFDPKWGSNFYCGFTLAVGLLSLLIAGLQLFRMSIFLNRGTDSSFLSAFLDSIIAGIMVMLVVASAIFVTRGFSQWCSSVTERFPSCSVASVMKIKDEPDIDAGGFFLEMQTAQFGIWTCLTSWTMLLVLAARKLFVYHERENIIVSMARERCRYVGPSYDSVSE